MTDTEIIACDRHLRFPQGFDGYRRFYSLPRELLEAVVDAVGADRFDPKLLGLEREFSKFGGDHSGHIGVHYGIPIRYDLLADPPTMAVAMAELTEQDKKDLSLADAPLVKNLEVQRTVDKRLAWVRGVRRAYAGWLALNPLYAQEQEAFFETWGEQVEARAARQPTPEHTDAFAAASEAFLARWHLLSLAGPFLPVPVAFQGPVLMPQAQREALSDQGAMLFLPTIFPLPNRVMLREMAEDAIGRSTPAQHLREWVELVRSDSTAKKSLPRYERVFVLQHFWRALFSRHANSLHGGHLKVRLAFASFLFPKAETASLHAKAESVQKDLNALSAARGGPEWYLRPLPHENLWSPS